MKYIECMKCGHSFIENLHQCPTCGAIDFIVVDREDPNERPFLFLLKKWFRRAYGFSLLVVCLLCLILYTHFKPLVYHGLRRSSQDFISYLCFIECCFFLLLRKAYPSDISFLDYFGTIIIVFAFLFFLYYVEKKK